MKHKQEAPYKEEDENFIRSFWKLQRAGWLVFVLIVIAALLGMFGNGVFSKHTVSTDNLSVTYDRFARNNSPTRVEIMINSPHNKQAELYIDRRFIQQYEIDSINPEPFNVTTSGDAQIFLFPTTGKTTYINLTLLPQSTWRVGGNMRTKVRESVNVTQFIYP